MLSCQCGAEIRNQLDRHHPCFFRSVSVASGSTWTGVRRALVGCNRQSKGRHAGGRSHFLLLLPCLVFSGVLAAAGPPATTTTLAVTSGSGAVATVSSGTMVTLTATVKAGSVPVKTGQVNFCDASAKFCTDIHLLATAQLTSTGTATFKLRPGIGSRSYKAVFAGTPSYAASASSASPLKVTSAAAKSATSTSIAETGYAGNYTLTATVTGTKGTLARSTTVILVAESPAVTLASLSLICNAS